MLRFLQIAVTVLLLFAAVMVFISPITSLPQTALRAQQAAILLFLSILMAAKCIDLYCRFSFVPHFVSKAIPGGSKSISGLVSSTCVLLC